MRFLIAAVLCFVGMATLAQEYRLQPGDRVRVKFLGLTASEAISTIDTAGQARFPLLGPLMAQGLTIDELQDAAQVAAVGRRYSYVGDTGEFVSLDLDGFTAFAEIIEYRPVYVTGDVLRPGPVGFKPGQTLRAAIAGAGGVSILPGSGGSIGRARMQDVTRLRILSHELALKTAALWRVEALLSRNPELEEPEVENRLVSRAAFIQVMALERQRLDSALEGYNTERERLLAELAGIENLTEMLDEQRDMTETMIEADREELDRINQLSERGLTQNNRVASSRRNFAISSAQLLQILRSVQETDQEEKATKAALEALDREFRINALEEKALLLREETQSKIELEALRRALGADEGAAISTLMGDTGNQIIVIRNGERLTDITLDDFALPGDVIELRASFADSP